MGSELTDIAIIGMAGRFPNASSIAELWRTLCAGIEGFTHFRIEDLDIPDAKVMAQRPNYVRTRGIMSDVDHFDASFFGVLPREAELIDPQQRIFLECCWQAFEDAGYDPLEYEGIAAVYAGCSPNTYFMRSVCSEPSFVARYTTGYQTDNLYAMLGSSSDFLATRVAYKLNLKGPAYTLTCGCSTSLVAISQACMSLQNYQCDMALAGGVSITFPQKRGYLYEQGGIVSPDGHCRTFDERAQGTVFGDGAAVVLLKRLTDALADRDNIYAVIKGFGVTNDGTDKVGFTAPAVEGQARAIAMAHASAGIDPSTISYVEAHGTGTPLGDPIEIAALTKAFRLHTQAKHFCAIGTAKTTIGHLDSAAGVTGLIKTALSLKYRLLPPSLNFERPNPALNLDESPFYVNARLTEWKSSDGPLRAGVSSFGMGGTNAHVVLEEAPRAGSSKPAWPAELILLSARTNEALATAAGNLADFIEADRTLELGSVAYTTIVGRRPFDVRQALVARDADHAIELLRQVATKPGVQTVRGKETGVVFMFPGQGAQYAGMGQALYQSSSIFREHVDRTLEALGRVSQLDLRDKLFPTAYNEQLAATINNTEYAQPALFVIEYALAQTWLDLGIVPRAMIGHSVGEFVAACVAGVMSLEDAVRLVAERGRIMQALPGGAMTAVRLPEARLAELAQGDISIAAINAPTLGVLAGPFAAIAALEQQLDQEKVVYRRLHTSHAFHSSMMEPAVAPFTELVRTVCLKPPAIPFMSSVSGHWIGDEEAVSPEYWARHLRSPVRFSDGIAELRNTDWALLEVGPGSTLSALARNHQGKASTQLIQTSFPERGTNPTREDLILEALGQLWMRGMTPKWSMLFQGEDRRRVSLPTYPFERRRFWIEPQMVTPQDSAASVTTAETGLGTDKEVISPDRPETDGLPATAIGLDIQRGTETSNMAVTDADDRASRIKAALEAIFQDLSGIDVSSAGDGVSFLEMGFDSLFLTQVSQAIHSKFGVKITFRQLLDQVSTIDALVVHLDQALPPEAVPAVAAPAPAQATISSATPSLTTSAPSGSNAPAAVAAGPSGGALEDLFKSQLQAMSDLIAQQMSMLRGGAIAPPSQPSVGVAPTVGSTAAIRAAAPVASSVTRAETHSNGPQPRKFIPFRPVASQGKEEMTSAQAEHLRSLTERYNRKTQGSKRLTQENRTHLADPRVAAGFRTEWKELVYPIAIVRSKGSKLWDVDGNEYIDVVNGYGPIMFGHAPDFVVEAVEKQLKVGFETGPQSLLACEVAKMIAEMTGTERVSFCNTGSEAVVAAVRVARTVTARNKVVLFAGAYHGMFDEVVVKAVPGPDGPRSLPVAPGIPREKVENVVVLDYGTDEALRYIESHAHELAAILVEPVQSRHPGLQPVEFLKKVRRITEQSGTALIFDEVVTGFRVHQGGCQALFGIKADVATYGKVLAGGLPIGIVAGKAAFMDALDGGMWRYGDDSYPETGVTFFAGTFIRHPLALAATKAVLDHLKEAGPRLQEDLGAKTAAMAAELNAFLEERQAPSRVDSFGSIAHFTFPPELKFTSLFYYYMRLRGIYIQEGFPIFLTTAHSATDVAKIVAAFKESTIEMQAAGFLPGKSAEAYANGLDHAAAAAPSTASMATPQSTRAPLTESQIEIWLSAGLGDEQNCCYNESFTLKLMGELDRPALEKALDAVVARHEALRTKFGPNAEYQEFVSALKVATTEVDLSSEDEAMRSSRLNSIIESDARAPFDLAHGPLLRLQLIKLQPAEHHLIFTTHHIVCDGWSTNVILDELSQLYSGFHTGKQVDLPAPMRFGTYARTQAQHFEGESGARAEQYWLDQFKQLPPLLDLPLDRPRPALKSHEGATRRRTIPVAAYRAIKAAAARQKCTLFVMLLAGFEALLSRLSGQDDIVVGIPSAGQSLLEDEILVGHCVNFLPLRGRLSGDATMADFLAQTRKTLLDAYDHQNYTYGRLVRKLSIRRDPSRLPLLEVQFNLERVGGGMDFAGLKAEVDPNPKAFVNHDLFLNVIESDDGLTLDCDFNTRLLDASTVDRWLGHFETVLEAAAEDANRPISQLPLLTAIERRHLIEDWNQTATAYPKDRCINQLFEECVERTPDAIAVVFEDQGLTYSELDRRANQLAVYLRKAGVGPGTLIGIFVDRSLEMMVALLGVLKAGAAYVPMDPTYPAERIAHVLDDAKLPILLTQEKLVTNLPAGAATIIRLDADWNTITSMVNGAVPPVSAGPDDLAYVIYTSGSTGKPKGVEIPHRAVVNLLTAMAHRPGLTAADTLLAVTTLSFDIAGLELYLPLCVGAKVVIASREDAADGGRLLTRLASSEATVLQATPITFRLLIEAGWNNSRPLKMLCGGEALPRDLANAIAERASELWNMYGPTETTIWSSTVRIEPGDSPVVIGAPIANTQFHVIEANGGLAPFGRPGELLIGGDGLAHGYFQRPELTAEKFIRNPFSSDPTSRLYRTGDLVRRLGDGTFEFLGRLDNQVKLRGFRIELGEIEAVLSRYPGVREAVVALREDVPGDKRLVAYIVTEHQALSITAVREFLTGKLPNYMLPSAVVRMTAMPLTPNGKVDRKALPAPDTSTQQRSAEFVAPQTEEERTLAAIWAEVLRVERVGVQDNLFELGADSLHIFQIAARANKAGINLVPAQFLKYRTIAALLEQSRNAPAASTAIPPITRVARAKYRVEKSSF